MWHHSYSKVIAAPASAIWALFSDVQSWKRWNAGVETMEIFGPFAAGTKFRMKPPGQDVLESVLLEARENEGFVDETRVGDLTVIVSHQIKVLDPQQCEVTYEVFAYGPGCEEVGPAVSADFPEVLGGLERTVKSKG